MVSIYGTGSQEIPRKWQRVVLQTPLSAPPVTVQSLGENFGTPFRFCFVERVEVACEIFVGPGKQYQLGHFEPGDQLAIELPTEVDEIAVDWLPDVAVIATPAGSNQYTYMESQINPSVEVWFSNEPVVFSPDLTMSGTYGTFS